MNTSKKKGFTIVELVIVIAVIAILAAVLIPTFTNLIEKANESAYLQERTNQQLADLTEKIENQKFLTWEDFETRLAEELSKIQELNQELIKEAIKESIKEYLDKLENNNTNLTKEQIEKIIEKSLEGQLTTAQVEAIVKAAIEKLKKDLDEEINTDVVKEIIEKVVELLRKEIGDISISKEQMKETIVEVLLEELNNKIVRDEIEKIINKVLEGFGGNGLTKEEIKEIIEEILRELENEDDEPNIPVTPEKPEHTHTEEVLSEKNATCTETGLTEGKKCSECGEILIEQQEIPVLEHNYKDGECTVCGAIDPEYNTDQPEKPHAHTEEVIPGIEATCTSTGLTEGKKCAECGEILVSQVTIPALGHDLIYEGAVKPTCLTRGFTGKGMCTQCSYTISSEYIPPHGHKYENNVCTICAFKLNPSNGLELEYVSSSNSYVVVGLGTCTDNDIVIPANFNGLDVSAIHALDTKSLSKVGIYVPGTIEYISNAFEYGNISYVYLEEGVKSILSHAFYLNNAKIEFINIPSTIVNISGEAFLGSIEMVYLDSSHIAKKSLTYDSVGYLFYNTSNVAINPYIGNAPYAISNKVYTSTITFMGNEYNVYHDSENNTLVNCHHKSEWFDYFGFNYVHCTNCFEMRDFEEKIFDISRSNSDNVTAHLYKENGDVVLKLSGEGAICDDVKYSFYNGIITKVIIEKGITNIPNNLFINCTTLKEIVFEENSKLKSIGDFAFGNCTSLERIEISASVTSIGLYAFSDCENLTIYCEAESQPDGWDENWNSSNCPVIWGYCEHNIEHVSNKEATCTEDGNKEYWYCNKCNNYYDDNDCINEMDLGSIIIPALGHNYTGGKCIICGDDDPNYGDQCSEGLEFTLNADQYSYTVTGIGECTDTELIIPSEYNNLPVTSIGEAAFSDCTNLISVKIPTTVTSIGHGVFRNCTNLVNMTIPLAGIKFIPTTIHGPALSSPLTYFGYIFGASASTYNNYFVPSSLKEVVILGEGELIGNNLFIYCENIERIKISSGITNISSSMFAGCSKLSSVQISDTVTSIGGYAFANCTSLESIELPDSITSIGDYAFSGCTALESVEIPRSVTSIGERSFSGCTSLKTIIIPNNVTDIFAYAFSDCTILTIYCESAYKLSNWHENWNASRCPVVWSYVIGD